MERPKGDGREDPVRGQACPSATPRNAPRWMNQEGKGGSLLVSAFRAIEARTGEDFCLGVMMLCGLLAIVAMVPFGAYLAWMGSYQLVALDLALIMVTGAAITYAWRRGSSAVAALVLVARGAGAFAVGGAVAHRHVRAGACSGSRVGLDRPGPGPARDDQHR